MESITKGRPTLRAQLLAQVVLLGINAILASQISYYWCHCMRFHSSYERDLLLFRFTDE